MTAYINYMAFTQKTKDGNVPTQGNAVADAETVSSGGTSAVAPEGTQYIAIWSDAATTIEINIVSLNGSPNGEAIYNAKEIKIPANALVEIPNIVAGVSTVTVTDI